MEEKERYYYKKYAGDYDILDRNDKNAYYGAISRDEEDAQNLINLLNQQDKRIKEFEQENQRLKDQVKKSYQEGLFQKQFDKDMEIQELKDKIEQLKQSQKQLAIEELEKLREYIVLNDEYDEEIGCNIIKTFDLIEDLADKIKSLKGEE